MILHVGPLGGEGQKLAVGMLTLHSVPGSVPLKYKGNGCGPQLSSKLSSFLPDHLSLLKISVLLCSIPNARALG